MKPHSFLVGFLFAIAPAGLPAAVSQPPAAIAQPAEVSLSETLLTTMRLLNSGKPVAVSAFTTKDEPAFVTTFTWPNSTMSGGIHKVTWNWYNKGVLVSTTTHPNIEFKTCPHTLKTSRPPSVLGPGPIRVDVLIDGKVLSSASFEIKKD